MKICFYDTGDLNVIDFIRYIGNADFGDAYTQRRWGAYLAGMNYVNGQALLRLQRKEKYMSFKDPVIKTIGTHTKYRLTNIW